MELTMEERDYFCIGNLGDCRNTIEITLTVIYADKTEKVLSGADIVGDGKRSESTMFRDGVLWISTYHNDKKIAGVYLSLNNPNGTIEQYCLRWGIAPCDLKISSSKFKFIIEWQKAMLRHDEIAMAVNGDKVSILMLNRKCQTSDFVDGEENYIEKTVEDIELCISADRKILGYYYGDARVEAENLLNMASENVKVGNIQEASDLLREAEEKLAHFVNTAMLSVRKYTAASNK